MQGTVETTDGRIYEVIFEVDGVDEEGLITWVGHAPFTGDLFMQMTIDELPGFSHAVLAFEVPDDD